MKKSELKKNQREANYLKNISTLLQKVSVRIYLNYHTIKTQQRLDAMFQQDMKFKLNQ